MNEPVFVGRHSTTYSVQRHEHEDWELIYCTGGTGEVVFDNQSSLRYDKGEIVLIPAHTPHFNQSEKGFTNIHMRLSDAAFPYRTAMKVADDADGHLLTFFSETLYYFNSDIRRKELVLSALGEVIASYIVMFLSQNNYSELVERIRNDILHNFTNCDYRLEDTLRSLPLNYDYIRKTFKKETGVTPHEYLTKMRMKKAEMLLSAMQGEYFINEIAQMCGYSEPLYFTRVFKKTYGLSPTAFNRECSGEKQPRESVHF